MRHPPTAALAARQRLSLVIHRGSGLRRVVVAIWVNGRVVVCTVLCSGGASVLGLARWTTVGSSEATCSTDSSEFAIAVFIDIFCGCNSPGLPPPESAAATTGSEVVRRGRAILLLALVIPHQEDLQEKADEEQKTEKYF